DGPTLTLAAQVTDAMGQGELRDAHLAEALPAFGGLRSIDDWELGWLMTAARMAGDTVRLADAQAEQRRRKTAKPTMTTALGGHLPDEAGALVRAESQP
ncbi:MAG: hypothetical protein AB7I50_26810, partial [Vicinamibacterales bacterium]